MKYLNHPILYLLALLTNGEVVVLRNHNRETIWSVAWTDAWGDKYARPHTLTKIGHVVLFPNGTCGGQSCYITQWKKA